MTAEPIDDVLDWAKKLSSWKQDALRRLAISNDLTDNDLGELLAMVKIAAGFSLANPPPGAVPFAKAHFGGGKHQPIILKGIANVENIKQLQQRERLLRLFEGGNVLQHRLGLAILRDDQRLPPLGEV